MQYQLAHEDCQSRSFQYKDLRQANFHGIDIRGANFTGADLTGADFSNACAGIPDRLIPPFIIAFGGTSFLLLSLSCAIIGLLTTLAFIWSIKPNAPFLLSYIPAGLGEFISGLLLLHPLNRCIPSFTFLALLAWYLKSLQSGGLKAALRVIVITIASSMAATVSIYIFAPIALLAYQLDDLTGENLTVLLDQISVLVVTGLIAAAIGVILASITMLILLLSFISIGVSISVLQIVASLQLRGRFLRALQFCVAMGAILAISEVQDRAAGTQPWISLTSLLLGLLASGLAGYLELYVCQQVLNADTRFSWITNTAVRISASQGTCFSKSCLADANFAHAHISGTDFREATLTRVNWEGAKKLHHICADHPHLRNPAIRSLVASKVAVGINLPHSKLAGINLAEAQLNKANLEGADLYGANLQGADLRDTCMNRSNLDTANLTKANLTGAKIENWGITKGTQLDRVVCEHVYICTSSSGEQERLPQQGSFKPGEFEAFQKAIARSILLDHKISESANIDLIIKALKQVSWKQSLIFEVLSIEKHNQRLYLRVLPEAARPLGNISPGTSDEQIKQSYHKCYRELMRHEAPDSPELESDIVTALGKLKKKLRRCNVYLYNHGLIIRAESIDIHIEQSV